MHNQIKTLQSIVTRKGSSQVLTFSTPHVLLALELLSRHKYTSRQTFYKELHIGEGAARTLVTHLKEFGLANSIRAGTFLTQKGMRFAKKFFDVISSQCMIEPCNIARERYNHAILLKDYARNIGNGMDQRDYAILYGAKGATTLSFENNRFVFPGEEDDCLRDDPKTKKTLLEKLKPKENDLIIIGSSDEKFVAKISSINSVLWTLAFHERN